MFLTQVIKKLNDEKIDYVLVGGFAMALHGVVRATMESLLKMKEKAGRPQDLVDIQSIKGLINEKNKKS